VMKDGDCMTLWAVERSTEESTGNVDCRDEQEHRNESTKGEKREIKRDL
jgi:hypothetical protein